MKRLVGLILPHTLLRFRPRITVSDGLLCLALILFLLDHKFSELTWGGLALATGALLTRGNK
jgi:hypothetical protein